MTYGGRESEYVSGSFSNDDIIGGCLSALARSNCISVHLAADGVRMECESEGKMAVHDLIRSNLLNSWSSSL